MRKKSFLFLLFALILCSAVKGIAQHHSDFHLKFVNAIEVPFGQQCDGTQVGGLSGIDYDEKRDVYYLISDDRSVYNPARFYTAKIHLNKDQLGSIDFLKMTVLKNESGQDYASWEASPSTSTDPEDIRYNPKTDSFIWSNEGARVIGKHRIVLQNPSINFIDFKGNFRDKVELPSNLEVQRENKGPRNNVTLESLSFDDNYQTIYTCLEEPLIQDGDPSTANTRGLVRLYRFDTKTKKNSAQYAYELEPIAVEPILKDAFADNGVSAIQYFGEDRLLTVERSYTTGMLGCTIKVFLCDLKKAVDVKGYESLLNQNAVLVPKKLILNMDSLGIPIDNIEGVTFGPKLSNGNRTLIFVSDNNFSFLQQTQLLLFEVIE